jgi:hypothetical protein
MRRGSVAYAVPRFVAYAPQSTCCIRSDLKTTGASNAGLKLTLSSPIQVSTTAEHPADACPSSRLSTPGGKTVQTSVGACTAAGSGRQPAAAARIRSEAKGRLFIE